MPSSASSLFLSSSSSMSLPPPPIDVASLVLAVPGESDERLVVQPLEFGVARRERVRVVPLLKVGIVVTSTRAQQSRQLGVLRVAPRTGSRGLELVDPILPPNRPLETSLGLSDRSHRSRRIIVAVVVG